MPLLYYWRPDNYRRDLDQGAGFNLNQANPILHSIEQGDSLWAFSRTQDGRYVLAAELVVWAKTINPTGFRYGKYRVWGDLKNSRYFDVSDQVCKEEIVRQLSVTTRARHLGKSFQGRNAVKKLTLQDHRILSKTARQLSLEARAQNLPEERLEAALLLGGRRGVNSLISQEHTGMGEKRKVYLSRHAPARSRRLTARLQELYNGRCQLSGWTPRKQYGHNLCHAHHVQWLSRGGEDRFENLVLVSPNLHAAIHRCDAPLDYERGAFIFRGHTEPVRYNRHLPIRSQESESAFMSGKIRSRSTRAN